MLESHQLVYKPLNLIDYRSEIARFSDSKTDCNRNLILCAYQNRTSSLQIIKIENIANFFWEKVVFPSETILFNSVESATLKVYSNDNATAVLSDTISCSSLQVCSN